MKSTIQKKLAADITKRSKKRIALNQERLEDIKEAITRQDVKGLIKDGAILLKPKQGVSRGRARKAQSQKSKGRRRGQGTRKGKAGARLPSKEKWIKRIRLQRDFLRQVKGRLSPENYKNLYRRAKGGFFRSKRHMKLYITEHNLWKNGK